jgi:tripartite-type tricarboxylate transporter receptor subunit TctC
VKPLVVRVLAACAAAIAAGQCLAQQSPSRESYPVRSIRIIVAASPGSADEFFARTLGQSLEAVYRQRIVIDSRPGAGGLIGNAVVSKGSADGYTLGMVGVTRIITALMREPPPYQPLADITGVAHVASITNVLVVTPTIQARTAREFVNYARVRPGELNYASTGIGSAAHLAGEVFSRALGIDAVHVPFRAMTNTVVEMALGEVHYAILTLPATLGPLHDRRLRALAVMTPQRSVMLPDVPAIAEAGLPEAQFDSWAGVVVPTGTPRRIVEQLHGDIVQLLRQPAMRKRFLSQGAESTTESTPDGFMRYMQEEYLRYQTLISQSGVKAE